MKFNKIKNIVTASLFAAVICVLTFVVMIPSPAGTGYLNLGDCFVILSGILLPPGYAMLSAGVGSALADLLAGYVQYAPATFVIKALMAFTVYIIYKHMQSKRPLLARICTSFSAEVIMILGYFIYEAIFLHYGVAAVSGIYANSVQGIANIVSAIAVATLISKNKAISDFFRKGK